MKKYGSFWAVGVLWSLCATGQGLQPSLLNECAIHQNKAVSNFQVIINNYHLQSDVNDLYAGYHKSLKKVSLWVLGGFRSQSLIKTKQLQAGTQISLGAHTFISQEILFTNNLFPEFNTSRLWLSNSCIEYQNNLFQFQYRHHWNWLGNISFDLSPVNTMQVSFCSSTKHQLRVSLWQFASLPSQIFIQHRIFLSKQCNIAWGFQWPSQKYFIVLYNNKWKIQSNLCITMQPYFLPSLYQLHEFNLD